jgi:hypothetical protein
LACTALLLGGGGGGERKLMGSSDLSLSISEGSEIMGIIILS